VICHIHLFKYFRGTPKAPRSTPHHSCKRVVAPHSLSHKAMVCVALEADALRGAYILAVSLTNWAAPDLRFRTCAGHRCYKISTSSRVHTSILAGLWSFRRASPRSDAHYLQHCYRTISCKHKVMVSHCLNRSQGINIFHLPSLVHLCHRYIPNTLFTYLV